MEFNIIGQECHDFEHKRKFYTRYPIDLVNRVLLYLKQEIPNISRKFNNNKLSIIEKKRICELIEYFNTVDCQDYTYEDIHRSYPKYIFDKLSLEEPSLYLKLKNKVELNSKEKEKVCIILNDLLNCSNFKKAHFLKDYKGKRLDSALRSLKKDPNFFKKFHSDTLTSKQKSNLCYMLKYQLQSLVSTTKKSSKKKKSYKKINQGFKKKSRSLLVSI